MPTLETPTHDLPAIDLGETREIGSGPATAEINDTLATGQRGINIGGHTVTRSTEHLPADQRDLIRWLHHYARRNHLSWAELKSQTEIDNTTIYRIMVDTYRYPKDHAQAGLRVPLDKICARIKKFKFAAEKDGKATNPDFIQTTVADRVHWLCDRSARNKKMGFIFGDGQVGVSTALREFAAKSEGRATYVEVPPGGVVYMLKKIAMGLDVPDSIGYYKMLEGILGALDPSKTLILDEMDRPFWALQRKSIVKGVDTIRYIKDQTGCGLVMAGNNMFRDQIEKGEFRLELRRCRRRGRSHQLQLATQPPREDLAMFAEHYGLDLGKATPEAITIVDTIAKEDGIGVFKDHLLDARDYAQKKGQDINWTHFVKAYAITEKAGQRLN